MYQHARQRQRNAEATRRASVEPAHTPVVGKRTLTEGLAAPAAGEHVLDTVKRELRAVGSVALPAYLVIAERTDLDPVAKQIQLADAAAQVRHLLMTARQQLAALEKLAPDRGVMLARRAEGGRGARGRRRCDRTRSCRVRDRSDSNGAPTWAAQGAHAMGRSRTRGSGATGPLERSSRSGARTTATQTNAEEEAPDCGGIGETG